MASVSDPGSRHATRSRSHAGDVPPPPGRRPPLPALGVIAGAVRGARQSLQNLAPAGFSCPQDWQVAGSRLSLIHGHVTPDPGRAPTVGVG